MLDSSLLIAVSEVGTDASKDLDSGGPDRVLKEPNVLPKKAYEPKKKPAPPDYGSRLTSIVLKLVGALQLGAYMHCTKRKRMDTTLPSAKT